ncbi:MAG: ATP-binding cassette domain-containing protein [Acidobacteria bacterium]|nr:ATP-binding cassette domain-containing protein [Acidobacteriota bacterium]
MSLLTESDNLTSTWGEGLDPAAESVVRLEAVSVVYRAPSERIKTFKEYAIRLVKRQVEHREFRALDAVNLEVRRGEVFGLVGHNGAGKSTLLKIVSRVMKPTSGRVWVKGKIAPLLELGAGFHTELSGRENVFLNGTLLGYSRAEMEALFDGIVEFAELGDFIDAPLRTYSTGMTVRLGFAVATATRPDILIVDEVLAVGDEQFQEKCTERIMDFRREGTTILLVTHSSKSVERICDRAAWLDHGRLRAVGMPADIIDQYHAGYHRSAESRSATRPEALTKRDATVASAKTEVSEEMLALEAQAMKRDWFYQFELPSGSVTDSFMLEASRRIHKDRLAMLDAVLAETFAGDVTQLSCLDIGCNQGFFSVEMARRGFRKVLGVDVRRPNIEDANLMRQIYDLNNLRFRVADVGKVSAGELGQFDVVMMLSVLFWLENPIGALRLMKALTGKLLVIETPVAPDLSGELEWGNRKFKKPMQGSFAVLDQTTESKSPIGSSTDLSLCPGRETLIWILQKLGFTNIRIIPPPADAHEQLASGNRIMIVAQA